MISWPETSEVTPKINERRKEGDMIGDADSERVWDKRGLNELSDPRDPPKLPSSECSLIDPMSKAAVQQHDVHDLQLYVFVVTASIQRDRHW